MPLKNTMKALADPTRCTILNLLKKSSLSAGDIAENFEMSLPAVDHIKRCRFDQRQTYIFYELNDFIPDEDILWIRDLRCN